MSNDFSGFIECGESLQSAAEDFAQWLEDFLLRCAEDVIAVAEGRTKVRTGNLRRRWEVSAVERDGDTLRVWLLNPTEYASFQEYGWHQSRRFVPGEWGPGGFHYMQGATGGMMLTEKDIPGAKMLTVPLEKMQEDLPSRLGREFEAWWHLRR